VPAARLFGWHRGLGVLIPSEDGQHDAIMGRNDDVESRLHGSASWDGASPRRGVLPLADVAVVGREEDRGRAGTAWRA
jgi:hypothetical protein